MKKRSMIYVIIAAMTVTLFASAPAAEAAKKPALNKKSASLKVGDKLKLKVKNNKKTVKWSTSKKKVATVTKKGVVTAKSAGKAKITAKIGKTKLVCKVTVTKKDADTKTETPVQTGTKIVSITAENAYQIKVQLSAPQVLTAANFAVKSKVYELGKYIRTHKIQSISTTDNINYLIDLAENNAIEYLDYVQVTVTGLSITGTDIKETFYNQGVFTYESSSVVVLEKGERCDTMHYYEELSGNTEIVSISGVPEGINYTARSYGVYFFGTAVKTGTFTVKIKASDEFGSVNNSTVTFIIGSDTVISAYAYPVYSIVNADGTMTSSTSIDRNIKAVGGSSSYDYAIEGSSYGMTIDEYGEIGGVIKTPGSYTVNIKITDKVDPSLSTTCTLNVNVAVGRKISGVIRDISGAPISKAAYAELYNKDRSSRFAYNSGIMVNEKGEYSIIVPEGDYSAFAYCNGSKSQSKTLSVKADMTGVDFIIPVYKLSINYEGADLTAQLVNWVDKASGYYYGSEANTLYLPEGTYNIAFDFEDGLMSYSGSADNLVVNAASPKTVNVKVNVVDQMAEKVKGTIGVEEKDVTLSSSEGYQYYSFTPSESKTYYFYSEGSYDTMGELRSENGEMLTGNDDDGTDNNFLFSYSCEKGKKYYFGVAIYSGSDVNVKIGISDTEITP